MDNTIVARLHEAGWEPGPGDHRWGSATITEFDIPGDDPNPIGVVYQHDRTDQHSDVGKAFRRTSAPMGFFDDADAAADRYGTQAERTHQDSYGVYFATSGWALAHGLSATKAALHRANDHATGIAAMRAACEQQTVSELRKLAPDGTRGRARKAELIDLLVELAGPNLALERYAGTLYTGETLGLPRRGTMKIIADHLFEAAQKGTLIIGDAGAFSFAGGLTLVDADDLTARQQTHILRVNQEHNRLMAIVAPAIAGLRARGYSIYSVHPWGHQSGQPTFFVNIGSTGTGQIHGAYTVEDLEAERFNRPVSSPAG